MDRSYDKQHTSAMYSIARLCVRKLASTLSSVATKIRKVKDLLEDG